MFCVEVLLPVTRLSLPNLCKPLQQRNLQVHKKWPGRPWLLLNCGPLCLISNSLLSTVLSKQSLKAASGTRHEELTQTSSEEEKCRERDRQGLIFGTRWKT